MFGRETRAAAAITMAVLVVSACGTTDKASRDTLPPIRTTIAVTTTTSTTVPEGRQFYVIQRGDTLAAIAGAYQVTVQSIVELNALANPDAIQAGQTIEIPSGIVVANELPTTVAPPGT